MDRGDRARMAAREGDEVLVGLFRRRDPRLQVRHRPILEVDHRTHAGKLSPDMVKMRWRNDLRVLPLSRGQYYEMLWPVFFQSARNASSPRSASGWLKSWRIDRQRVVQGKSVSVRLEFGGGRVKKKKTEMNDKS